MSSDKYSEIFLKNTVFESTKFRNSLTSNAILPLETGSHLHDVGASH